jgi:hypothetical protein
MKRVFLLLLALVLAFPIVCFFIPVTSEKRVFVASTYQNIISSTTQPKNWIKWDSSVRQAWHRDSSACSFSNDTTHHIINIDIPEKKIRITGLSYLLYQLEVIKNKHSSVFAFSIVPYIGNGQPRSEHNSRIIYAEKTNLLYKFLPFLEGRTLGERTISALRSYLENNTRFYGFPIELKQITDTLFLTKKDKLPKQELFKKLPVLFEELERNARENNCLPASRNVSYSSLGHDSLTILAGVHIDKIINGDYVYNFMQMPTGQFLAVGQFEGPFRDRSDLYSAVEKYLSDHQLVRLGVPFEKYLSPLPVSDSSIIKIELSYPLRY